ncbi:MAG: hypothetical protein AB7N76_24105 [Planctomycetota bacterium]
MGYHGCERALGLAVLFGRTRLRPSENDYDWLGGGTYFWEHGSRRALEWAQENRSEPFVIGAYLHLGRCFDLTDTWATARLDESYRTLQAVLTSTGVPMPRNSAGRGARAGDRLVRKLDCAVINLLNASEDRRKGGTYYQTVRGVFEEGDVAFPGACVRAKTHIQIAVRDPRCILGYFLPADMVGGVRIAG